MTLGRILPTVARRRLLAIVPILILPIVAVALAGLAATPAGAAVTEAPNFYIGRWSHGGSGLDEYRRPDRIAADGRGSVFILDSSRGRILRFGMGGEYRTSWGVGYSPEAMTLDPSGEVIYVANASRVDRYDTAGNRLPWSVPLTPPAGDWIHDISVDAAGNVYVLGGLGVVSIYGASGGRAATWNSGQSALGFAVDPDRCEVYLASMAGAFQGGRVWKYDCLGLPLGGWEVPETQWAHEVERAADGTLVVGAVGAGDAHRLFRYDTAGHLLTSWDAPEYFTDLTVDPTGLVVTSMHWEGGGVALYAPPPPAGIPVLQGAALPGFRFGVRIRPATGAPFFGRQLASCIPETICVSGAMPNRAEVFLRVVGPKPNGRMWPTLVKFSTSTIEIWVQQIATGALRYYALYAADSAESSLDGLFDRDGFVP